MTNGKRWEILSDTPPTDIPSFLEDLIKILLHNRGIETAEERENFLNPNLEHVTVESVGIDSDAIQRTIERLKKAQENREQVIIFGDYDVDGITGCAILWETCQRMGIRVMPYIPHRIDEGYGLSIQGIEHVREKYPETSLIITVDNGIVANEAISSAKDLGIDVIVTDHHIIGEKLPDAHAIIHTTKLCGAGVAWIIGREIAKAFAKPFTQTEYLDLVALGTIADLVPLIGANRILVSFGLSVLRVSTRQGIIALCAEAGIEQAKITVYDLSHIIAPRLNAMGRLESAMDSLRLLCTKNSLRARALSEKLGMTNKQRQAKTLQMTGHAKETIQSREALKNILIISHETYEQGIIGLIAGKLVETYYRPAIVLSKGEAISKASARSVVGFNIIEFLRSHADLLLEHGGHPMAAGFTIATENIERFQKTLEESAEKYITQDMLSRVLKIDCMLPITYIDQKLFSRIEMLAPFGMQNPEPLFASENVLVRDVRILGADRRHIKLRVGNGVALEAIGFGMGEWGGKIKTGDTISVAYTIGENTWNGKTSLQLKIRDIKMLGGTK